MGSLTVGLLGALVLGALGSWLFLWLARREGERWLGYLLIVSLGLKLLVVFVVSPIYYSHYTINDSNLYDALAKEFAGNLQHWHWVSLQIGFRVLGYSYLTGIVYALFGPSRYLMEVINALISTVGVFFFYKGLKLALSPQQVRLAITLIALMPSLLLWNSLHLRDAWLFLSIGLFTYGAALSMGPRWLKPFTLLAISLIGMLVFRAHLTAVGVAAALPLIVLFKPLGSNRRAALFARWGGFALIIPLGALLFVGSQKLTIGSDALSYTLFEHIHNLGAVGGSALPPVHFTSWGDLLAYLPGGILAVLFRPFPWEAYNISGFLASFENVLLFVLLLLSVTQWPKLLQSQARALWPSWAFMVLLVAVLAMFEGNLGTIFRQKAQIMPFLLALGVLGLGPLWERLSVVGRGVA